MQSDAKKLGIGKSTLHYLRENASDASRSFRLYSKKLEFPFSRRNRSAVRVMTELDRKI
jgi:hypothetical protein